MIFAAMNPASLPFAFLFAALVCAGIYDLRYYRLPNWLTLPGWVVGPALHFLLTGSDGLLAALAGLVLGLALGLPFWLCGWMGAGDIKLIALVGGFVGFPLIFPVLLAIALCGGVLALLALAWRGHFFAALSRLGTSLGFTLSNRQLVYIEPAAGEREVRMPYAIAIAAGTVTAVLLYG